MYLYVISFIACLGRPHTAGAQGRFSGGGLTGLGVQVKPQRLSTIRIPAKTNDFFHTSICTSSSVLPAQADRKLLAPKGGFLGGLGERGIGGSKCGATAAVALLYTGKDGGAKLLAANVGDARVLLNRGGKIVQLTEDHVPDRWAHTERLSDFGSLGYHQWCYLLYG